MKNLTSSLNNHELARVSLRFLIGDGENATFQKKFSTKKTKICTYALGIKINNEIRKCYIKFFSMKRKQI